MGKYNFNEDLSKSLSVERKVALFLESRGAINVQLNGDNRYDIRYKKNDKVLTLEIKEDQMFDKTGNVAIEVKSRGKASGLCSSIADNWCYVLGNDLFFIKRSELIYHILTHQYKTTTGGDGYTSYLVLIPVSVFTKICDVINGGLV